MSPAFSLSRAGLVSSPFCKNREFNKLRPLLQQKNYFKIGLRQVKSLRLFLAGHVVRNGRRVLSLDQQELFSCKGREWKIYYCEIALSSEPQI